MAPLAARHRPSRSSIVPINDFSGKRQLRSDSHVSAEILLRWQVRVCLRPSTAIPKTTMHAAVQGPNRKKHIKRLHSHFPNSDTTLH